jgi:predicted nucleic acid-binding protein
LIVSDANLIAYLVLESPWLELAREVHQTDGEWAAPGLWRFEFQNTIATIMRREGWGLPIVLSALETANRVVVRVQDPDPAVVFELVRRHQISAYDAQYAALALELGVPLVTQDKELLRKLPTTAVSMEAFLNRKGRSTLQEPSKKYRVGRSKRPR